MSTFHIYKPLDGVPYAVCDSTKELDALRAMIQRATWSEDLLQHREHMILVQQGDQVAEVIASIDRRDCDRAGEALVLSFVDGREIWIDIPVHAHKSGLAVAGQMMLAKVFDLPTEIMSRDELGF